MLTEQYTRLKPKQVNQVIHITQTREPNNTQIPDQHGDQMIHTFLNKTVVIKFLTKIAEPNMYTSQTETGEPEQYTLPKLR